MLVYSQLDYLDSRITKHCTAITRIYLHNDAIQKSKENNLSPNSL
jgi:hypothetical protein